MESGSGQVAADVVGKKPRDEFVDIPSYVEPVVGLSQREKLLYHGSGIAVGLFIAALIFAGWRYAYHGTAETVPPSIPQQTAATASSDTSSSGDAGNEASPSTTTAAAEEPASRPRAHHARANAGADVIAAAKPASGLMYVHRNNSDLRPAPSTSSEPIKKLAKGEKVQLLALSDKWAQVDDAGTKGWMRASVIKDTPPGEKKSRKKKSDDD
jgi:cytoskeletal protein RodZ